MLYDVYDVYDDSRRYNNATNTPTSDIMKDSINLIDHQCVRGALGRVGSAARFQVKKSLQHALTQYILLHLYIVCITIALNVVIRQSLEIILTLHHHTAMNYIIGIR